MEQVSLRRDAFHRRRRQSANPENDKMNDPIAQRSQRAEVSFISGMQPRDVERAGANITTRNKHFPAPR
jgi:hypothetical protein